MNFLHYLLAWRYIIGTRHNRTIAIMAYISFFGILIGTFSLALTLFIMNGFEKATHEKLQGIHAHVIMRAHGSCLATEKIMDILNKEFADFVEAASPTSSEQVILQSQGDDDNTSLVMLKGIDPNREQRISTLEEKITRSAFATKTLPSIVHEDYILIGERLANDLSIKPGDPITMIVPDTNRMNKGSVKLEQHQARIGGFFNTGIEEFDSGLIFCSLDFLQTLFPESGVTQLNIKLMPHVDDAAIVQRLRDRFSMEAYSWKELYPALVSALKLEKYVMVCILALITLVASMNIISLFFMQITQKRGDIAILRAMGMHAIRPVFLIMSITITGIAALSGLLLAGIIGWLLDRYPLITLPDAYYISKLPIAMEWHLALLVFGIVMLLGIIAAWIPIRNIHTINIAHVVRYEA